MPEFEQHEKVQACSLDAIGLFSLGLSYATRELTDGFIPAGWPEETREEAGGRAAQQLVDRGLWEPVEGGYRVHDFTDYNPTAATIERRKREREKKRRQRDRALARGQSPGDSPRDRVGLGTVPFADVDPAAIPHSEAGSPPSPARPPGPQATGGQSPSGGLQGVSTSTPTSSAASEQQGESEKLSSAAALSAKGADDDFDLATRREWEEWLSDYRLVTDNARVLGSAAARRAFAARRKEGRTLKDLLLATRGNWHQWGTGAERPNLNWTKPETVLRGANVEGYIAQGLGLENGQVPRSHSSSTHPASRRIAERLGRERIGGLG